MRQKKTGFTLLETIIALGLISLIILYISKTLTYSLDVNKKAKYKYILLQKYDFQKNWLMSRSFSSPDLQNGAYSKEEGVFCLHWSVKSETPDLKKIFLSVSYKVLVHQGIFYKSKFIGGQNE